MKKIIYKIIGILGSGIPIPLYISLIIAGKIEDISVNNGISLSFFLIYQQILVTIVKGGADNKLLVMAASNEKKIKHDFIWPNIKLYIVNFIILIVVAGVLYDIYKALVLTAVVWLEMLSTVRTAELIGYGKLKITIIANSAKQIGFILILIILPENLKVELLTIFYIYLLMCLIRYIILQVKNDYISKTTKKIYNIQNYSVSSLINVACWRADQIILSLLLTMGSSSTYVNIESSLQQMKIVEIYSYISMAVVQALVGTVKQINHRSLNDMAASSKIKIIAITSINIIIIYAALRYLGIESSYMIVITSIATSMTFIMNLVYIIDLKDEQIRLVNRKFFLALMIIIPFAIITIYNKDAEFLCLIPVAFMAAYLAQGKSKTI